jgi:xanthine dehydrogenase YagT iron-sulfur-binding subunit
MRNLVDVGAGADHPRVLAFVREWSAAAAPPHELHAMRAELRGLGAELVILSGREIWSFRPDDELECHGAGDDALRDIARAAADFEVAPDSDALFVVDGQGVVRFAHRSPEPLHDRLLAALSSAGEALVGAPAAAVLFTRREWNLTCLVTGFALAFLGGCKNRPSAPPTTTSASPASSEELAITLNVNGRDRDLRVDARTSLLDALREQLGLTGTKKGCDAGQCGSCTVLSGGTRVLSCLTLAAMAQGQKLVTIEGLARGDELHPMQQAFIEHDALQCGFCTPGQILSAVALLAEDQARTDDEVRTHMSGNLCRCGAYPNIVAAIQAARAAGA